MKRPIKIKFVIVFAIIVMAELFLMNIESLHTFHYFTKPLIVGSLIAYFVPNSKHLSKQTKYLTIFALVFSVIGDMFLMNSNKYFVQGLIAFLIAHVFYIFVFSRKRNSKTNPIGFVAVIALYGCLLFLVIKDGLDKMMIPVFIYMLVILTMAVFAYWRKGLVPKQSFYLVSIGALFFVFSDSLIALDKFFLPVPFARTGIILTYAFAQLLLVSGIIKQQ